MKTFVKNRFLAVENMMRNYVKATVVRSFDPNTRARLRNRVLGRKKSNALASTLVTMLRSKKSWKTARGDGKASFNPHRKQIKPTPIGNRSFLKDIKTCLRPLLRSASAQRYRSGNVFQIKRVSQALRFSINGRDWHTPNNDTRNLAFYHVPGESQGYLCFLNTFYVVVYETGRSDNRIAKTTPVVNVIHTGVSLQVATTIVGTTFNVPACYIRTLAGIDKVCRIVPVQYLKYYVRILPHYTGTDALCSGVVVEKMMFT